MSLSITVNRSFNPMSIHRTISQAKNKSTKKTNNPQIITQPTDQSINPSVNQSTNQSINHSTNLSCKQPINQSINQEVKKSFSYSVIKS